MAIGGGLSAKSLWPRIKVGFLLQNISARVLRLRRVASLVWKEYGSMNGTNEKRHHKPALGTKMSNTPCCCMLVVAHTFFTELAYKQQQYVPVVRAKGSAVCQNDEERHRFFVFCPSIAPASVARNTRLAWLGLLMPQCRRFLEALHLNRHVLHMYDEVL